jgi:archaeosine-15-forming tRNA-guanine transglycosylase
MNRALEKLRAIADYQFGYGAGVALFPDESKVEYSKNTGRPRHVFLGDILLANYRPNDALFTITIAGAERIIEGVEDFDQRVVVVDDVIEFIEQGKNLFSRHVKEVGAGIKPGQEAIILDSEGKVDAVGKVILTRDEMQRFKTGVAIKTRRGRKRHR